MISNTRGGFYWKDGIPYLRTTSVLGVISKPQLMNWYGKMVYYAMVQDPTIDERTALSAPYNASQTAKNRGTTVHSIADILEEGEVAPEFQKFSNAYWKAKKDLNVQEIDLDTRTFYDEELRTAGTIDKFWLIGGKNTLVDIKSGKGIYPEVQLQLSDYAHKMRLAGKKVDQTAVLLLEVGEDDKPTGNYQWKVVEEDFDAFLHAKGLYEWQNKEKLIKTGYLV